jgi:hypothetical protein
MIGERGHPAARIRMAAHDPGEREHDDDSLA